MFQEHKIHSSFVTLEDVIPVGMKGFNPVIYNPNKDSISFRCELLYRTIKQQTGYELTSEQLIHLTKYESHQLNEFVQELRKILNEIN